MNNSLDIFSRMLQSEIPVIDSYRVLIHNGHFVRNNQPNHLPDNIIVDCAASAQIGDNGFYMYVPAHTKLSKPVQIINLFDKDCEATTQTRNLVIIETGSAAELLIDDFTFSGAHGTCNDITEISLGETANLEMVRLQKLNSVTMLNTETIIEQATLSRMKTYFITLGGRKIHNRLKVKLCGKMAEHLANGLSLTEQTENVSNDIRIVHASPDCQSTQLFKNILSDKSTGAYSGRIVVEKNAQKTIAYQRNCNILLHPKSKINICPQLEIYADDVQCSHGATVGQLDAEALFYLRSRGISESEAKNMLLHAFACEALDSISCMSLKDSILRLIEQKRN